MSEIEDDMSEPENDPGPCVCADCQNARKTTSEQAVWSAEYWRERQAARAEVEDLTLDLEAANATIERIKTLIAPETQMAAGWLYGERCFCESDIREAIEAKP
jgi:hypothetical protein